MDLTTAQSLASSTIASLQSTLSGTIPVLYPFAIGVAVLFSGYAVLKSAWHRHV